jgi:hypothetical protein
MDTLFFATASDLRAWFTKHHDRVQEHWIRLLAKEFRKTKAGLRLREQAAGERQSLAVLHLSTSLVPEDRYILDHERKEARNPTQTVIHPNRILR